VPGAAARGQDFHRIILEHVKTKNADEAREAMQAHINQVWIEIQPQLDEVGSIHPEETGRLRED
jgi:DNA-binding GntR family transcriptional regulator